MRVSAAATDGSWIFAAHIWTNVVECAVDSHLPDQGFVSSNHYIESSPVPLGMFSREQQDKKPQITPLNVFGERMK